MARRHHRGGTAVDAQLAVYILSVFLDSAQADIAEFPDHVVRFAVADPEQHLGLATSKTEQFSSLAVEVGSLSEDERRALKRRAARNRARGIESPNPYEINQQ